MICRARCRATQALGGKSKSCSILDILGIDIDTYRIWIEFQFTPEMNWSKIDIDHVKPICFFYVTKDHEIKEVFLFAGKKQTTSQTRSSV